MAVFGRTICHVSKPLTIYKLLFTTGLANFNSNEGHTILQELAWRPHFCVFVCVCVCIYIYIYIESRGTAIKYRVWYATTKDPTTIECYNEEILSINQNTTLTKMLQRTMLQRTVFVNKIRMLQRTWRNTIGQRIKRVRVTCRVFPLSLERQSLSLLSFVRFSYQFSSVIGLFESLAVKIFFLKSFCYIISAMSRQNRVRMLDGNIAVGCGPGTDYP